MFGTPYWSLSVRPILLGGIPLSCNFMIAFSSSSLVPVSWDEALDYTAERIRKIIDRDGPDVFSAFGSGRVPNETNYAIAKFTRAVVKTNNVDHCART